jgi:hypothetical protein
VLGRDIQMATQHLRKLNREILKTNALINISLLHREHIQLGVDVTMMGKDSVTKPDFVLLALVALATVFIGHAFFCKGREAIIG